MRRFLISMTTFRRCLRAAWVEGKCEGDWPGMNAEQVYQKMMEQTEKQIMKYEVRDV